MKSSRSRLIFDIVLVASMLALSFLPAVGTEEGHFAIASKVIRIIAGVYTVLLVLGHTVLRRGARLAVDVVFAIFLASMAWFEMFPAGNHIREKAIYAAMAGIIFGLALMSSRTPERAPA